MKTIGEFIREGRIRKHYSIRDLEDETKIKAGFINAIERQKWDLLPAFAVLSGFVKNIGRALEIDEGKLIAILRRDYPPGSVNMSPKPEIPKNFFWSPKLTFFIGIGIVVLIVMAYLLFQYNKFSSPPGLMVLEPRDEQIVNNNFVRVLGKTDTDATISVNNQAAIVDPDGNFDTQIEVVEGTKDIEIKAKSRSGKETIIKRNIKVEL